MSYEKSPGLFCEIPDQPYFVLPEILHWRQTLSIYQNHAEESLYMFPGKEDQLNKYLKQNSLIVTNEDELKKLMAFMQTFR